MQELDPLEVSTVSLEPDREHTLILGQPHFDTVLLSHFEVLELSPPSGSVTLIDLRVEQLSYLLTPVSLSLIQREQRYSRKRAEEKTRQQLQRLLGSTPPHLLQRLKPDRRQTRLLAIDIRWKPGQQLIMILKNCGTCIIDKVSLELVLYGFDPPLHMVN